GGPTPFPAVAGAAIATSVRFSSFARSSSSRGRNLVRTSSIDSSSKPGNPSSDPTTRSTFHAGRASPNGLTTPLQRCTRPSQLTNVPAVSVYGPTGSSTSAYGVPCRNGDSTTTKTTASRAVRPATGGAQSDSGSGPLATYA